jgi:hypothetical protein
MKPLTLPLETTLTIDRKGALLHCEHTTMISGTVGDIFTNAMAKMFNTTPDDIVEALCPRTLIKANVMDWLQQGRLPGTNKI